jgi:homotetrameric cytidine deaminase
LAIAADNLKPSLDLAGEEPTEPERVLFEAAKQAARHADPMHSHFFVGAALRSLNGTYTGANFENDSYGMTICAERAAIARAVDAEGHELQIDAIAVYAEDAEGTASRTPSPCGACRQVIYQYGPRRGVDTHVVFPVGGVLRRFRMVDLLAVPFEL